METYIYAYIKKKLIEITLQEEVVKMLFLDTIDSVSTMDYLFSSFCSLGSYSTSTMTLKHCKILQLLLVPELENSIGKY